MPLYDSLAAWEVSPSRYGAFGVDIFFALSGLLITRLLLAEHQRQGAIHLGGFYVRRVFRILPAYFLFLAGLTIAGVWVSGIEVVSALLFFRNYLPLELGSPESIHLWSLAIEEHFYLLWPGLLAVMLRFGRKPAAQTAVLLAIGIGMWRMLETGLGIHLFPNAPEHFRTDLRLDALLWGAVVAFSLDESEEQARLGKQLKLGVWIALIVLTCGAIMLYSLLTSMFVAVLIPFVLAGSLLHSEWAISRALSWAPVAWIGRISYSLYLWQQLFLVQHFEPGPAPLWKQAPFNLLLTFAIAIASYYLVEMPLIAYGRRMAGRLKQNWRSIAPAPGPVIPREGLTPQ